MHQLVKTQAVPQPSQHTEQRHSRMPCSHKTHCALLLDSRAYLGPGTKSVIWSSQTSCSPAAASSGVTNPSRTTRCMAQQEDNRSAQAGSARIPGQKCACGQHGTTPCSALAQTNPTRCHPVPDSGTDGIPGARQPACTEHGLHGLCGM